jgi:glycosyltransferase involved in cell wall biosynthesis
MLPLLLSLLALLGWTRLLLAGLRTLRAVPVLADVPPLHDAPSVSVIVPCRNEVAGVERAARSLLAQDLSALEVVAVNDRSSDATGVILDRLASEDRRLRVVHVAALPDGWLGKNHACAAGARVATGDWLLFTDGDVVFGPDAVRRALAYAEARGLGHVAAAPRLVAPGVLERGFVSAFAVFAAAAFRPWELSRAGTRAFAGVGAFNLVRRDAYLRAGGHARLALEVVDDVKLGLLLRRSGVPQGLVNGGALVTVRWQHGFRASLRGLVKNAFAATEYRVALAVAAAAWVAFLGAAPLAFAALAHGPARGLGVAALLVSALLHGATARRAAGGSGVEGVLMPACAVLLGAVLLASGAAARLRGGVVWRGTFYPLARLRAGGLRVRDLPASGAAGWPGARPVPPERVARAAR